MSRKRKIQYVEESDDEEDDEEEVYEEEEPVLKRKKVDNGIPSAPNPVVNVPQVSTFEGNEIQVREV